MLHGFMKSKFHSKCKSATKQMKSRIEIIGRKRNAMQKYLKNDIADLLKTGLDINAYGRAEGLQIELNLSSCYDFLEQFRECISGHISMMDRQRECPEECREAVSSLMFAAARFADLPELRQLRSIFTDRYGNSLESYVNQEFVEKLNSKPPTKEMKLQLMQNIALESGIEWNPKALEQKLYIPPAPEQDWSKNAGENKHKEQENGDESFRIGDNQGAEYKHGNGRGNTASKGNKEDQSSYGRIEVNNEEAKQSNNRERTPPTRDIEEASTNQDEQKGISNTTAPKEEIEVKIPFYQRLIPPYIRPKVSKTETTSDVPPTGSGRDDVVDANPKPKSVRRTRLKPPPSNDSSANVGGDGLGKMNSNGTEKQVEGPLKLPSGRQAALDASNDTRTKSKDGPPSRATSSPLEPTSPTESLKAPAQVSSFEPDTLNQTGPAQPKLPPDYDDLLVRLAALRGK